MVYRRQLMTLAFAVLLTAGLSSAPGAEAGTSSAKSSKAAARELPAVEQPLDSFEFTFYYQRIEEAVPVQAGTPAAAVEAVRERLGKVARVPVSSRRKRLIKADLSREGRQDVVGDDSRFRYRVFVTKVRDEAHLLQLMGSTGDATVLSDGQRSLLAAYRKAKEQALIDRMKQGARPRVEIVLTDTNGHNGSNVQRDFWPYSNGELIQISSLRFNQPGGEEDARSTLVHECAHSMDRAQPERDFPYGPDGIHHINEVTKPRAAFMEGWAVFLQMHDAPEVTSWWSGVAQDVMTERAKGEYDVASATALDGMTLTRVEIVNALILLKISALPDGLERLYRTFRATNRVERTLSDFLKDYVARNPDQAVEVARILDERTYGKLSDGEMKQFLGSGAAVDAFLAARRAAAEAMETPSPAAPPAEEKDGPAAPVETGQEVEVESGSQRNPFLGGNSGQ